jgi:hypothetical protein
MKPLIDHLNNYPVIKGAYLNKEGEWLFKKKEGFEFKTREEILEGKTPAVTGEEEKNNKTKKK